MFHDFHSGEKWPGSAACKLQNDIISLSADVLSLFLYSRDDDFFFFFFLSWINKSSRTESVSLKESSQFFSLYSCMGCKKDYFFPQFYKIEKGVFLFYLLFAFHPPNLRWMTSPRERVRGGNFILFYFF